MQPQPEVVSGPTYGRNKVINKQEVYEILSPCSFAPNARYHTVDGKQFFNEYEQPISVSVPDPSNPEPEAPATPWKDVAGDSVAFRAWVEDAGRADLVAALADLYPDEMEVSDTTLATDMRATLIAANELANTPDGDVS